MIFPKGASCRQRCSMVRRVQFFDKLWLTECYLYFGTYGNSPNTPTPVCVPT